MGRSDLEGRVALVTGASSGIGASIARGLLEQGVRVHGAARRANALDEVGGGHVRTGRFVAHELDVSDSDAVLALGASLAAHDPVDIVVCAAGTNVTRRRFEQIDVDVFDHVMRVNVHGAFAVMRATLDQLRRRGGDIIVISSIAASWPDHSGTAYGASKAALLGLARGVSRDEHVHGIRVCTILPGLVNTPLIQQRPVPPSREVLDQAIDPDDIAQTVVSVLALPSRTNIAEISMVATRLQSLGDTQSPTPELHGGDAVRAS